MATAVVETKEKKTWAELFDEGDSNDTVTNSTGDDSKLTLTDTSNIQEEGEVNFRTHTNLFGSQNKSNSENHKFEVPEKKTPCKKTQLAQDDLSLTGHLDTFHMASPLKVKSNLTTIIDEETKISPFKNKRKHTQEYNNDESPSKVTRSSERNRRRQEQHTPYGKFKDGTRKRHREDSIASPSTPGSGKKLEYETDQSVLLRRQKQIDFGKNTVGYDRYCQMVKKDERTKDHPKTPPRDLKYSRRAWDGLIKSWRSRLHFWDPPNENGEPNSLDLDDDEDFSSLDSQSVDSLPCTPIQEWKRRVRAKRESHSEDEDEDCKPLRD